MAPITAQNMEYDDALWAKSDEMLEAWKDKIFKQDVLREVGRFIAERKGGLPDELFTPRRGAFNLCFHMAFKNGSGAMLRFPIPGSSMFPEEKVKREVAVMQFLEYFTSFRVPHVFQHGCAKDSPVELGPFILMEYINHETNFIKPLNTPGLTGADRPILDPNVEVETLESIYGQMADVMLQIAKPTFSGIGCIDKANPDDEFDDTWIAKHRPLTFNMNELVQLGGVAPDQLPQHPFETASSFYQALAELHMVHLASQRNDAIASAEDCRQKYVARCLFRKIACEHKLSPNDAGPFRLFCDDFRPANVLAGKGNQLAAVIDLEYTYSAPTGYAYDPPSWLLLEQPESWEPGLDDWVEKYEKVLPTFLKALKAKEDAGIERGVLKEEHRLSHHMLKSWESGDFWVNYAARKSWAFDLVYWAKIDRRFFGEGDIEDRLKLLTEEERAAMDGFVEMKLKQKEEGGLGDWDGIQQALEEIEKQTLANS
ncbi:uncharacterized protein DSM5745_08659 [Aspergillus mulundensis]|uniref:Aminoglycoside phosphotransferase domain-containing protein n=1 Tax=Aspergillus mulundensis TaxID=1810919 RepID=A0A3D8R4F5_9EURO|nr:Uncharacterized protein DSM5745_08659 [Aspergillus mulundensis]RDW68899.1 Uncharacterized protein DSM5745_08659 [Aspergillus mulundensis]